ncbi:hypothetical protein [Peptacetobacter sp. AB800]|uniref:hypothetical protein n=1 Tax=Peptacetobacter sp. AB800 TaxID=3388428 RepID=UPI0039FC696B
MNTNKIIAENCDMNLRLFDNLADSCVFCKIRKICRNYYGCNIYGGKLEEEMINKWKEKDKNMAFNLIATYPIRLPLEKVNIQNLQKGDLSLFSESEIIKCLKELDNKCEKLQEEIDYDYELSLGWDI